MIHEFAVEPEVMATWDHFRVLWDDFGAGRGRFLVEYPNAWRKQAYALAGKLSNPVRANAICSKLSDPNQRHRLVGPSGRSFDNRQGCGWLDNVVAQQQGSQPFRAIVARSNSSRRPDVLPAAELERDTEPWKVPTQDNNCPRLADEMVRRVAMLLSHSEELVLVDRNFNPLEPRFVKPFQAFVAQRPRWKRLELHTSRPDPFHLAVQDANYRRGLELAVPAGTVLTVYFWLGVPAGERLHPRFVLTERGGVHFDWGLDEGEGARDTTLVKLLEHEAFLQLRQNYCGDSRAFGTPDAIGVPGRG